MESEKIRDTIHKKNINALHEVSTKTSCSNLEASYQLGLAGLRQYVNQLRPLERSKLIAKISENIKNIN